MEFFREMDALLSTFWYIAIPVSIVFIVQMVMTFIGADAGDGLEADFDGDLSDGDSSFQLFSFRNLINFLLGFSWTGISFFETIENKNLLIFFAFLVGAIFVAMYFVIIKQLMKLAEDNTVRIADALDKTAEVYLFIPAGGNGKGKVQLSIKGSIHEFDAISKGASYSTGTIVRIVGIESNNLLVVEK